MAERRSQPKPGAIPPDLQDPGAPPVPAWFRDPETGWYTKYALTEFIQYEIDGSGQTERHERFVTPLCLVAVGIDALPSLPDDETRSRLVALVGDLLAKHTRRADRMGRDGNEFLLMLRRTLATRVRDYYAPHAREAIAGATGKAAMLSSVSFGIASLTEHLAKSAEDLITKALVALAVARTQGPGSVVVYDFKTMPY